MMQPSVTLRSALLPDAESRWRTEGHRVSLTDDSSVRSQVTELELWLEGRSGRIGVKPLAADTSFLAVQRDYSDNMKRGVRSLWALQMWCVHLLHCYIAGDIMFSSRLVSDFMLALFILDHVDLVFFSRCVKVLILVNDICIKSSNLYIVVKMLLFAKNGE